jgi:hypothetical protein
VVQLNKEVGSHEQRRAQQHQLMSSYRSNYGNSSK